MEEITIKGVEAWLESWYYHKAPFYRYHIRGMNGMFWSKTGRWVKTPKLKITWESEREAKEYFQLVQDRYITMQERALMVAEGW